MLALVYANEDYPFNCKRRFANRFQLTGSATWKSAMMSKRRIPTNTEHVYAKGMDFDKNYLLFTLTLILSK